MSTDEMEIIDRLYELLTKLKAQRRIYWDKLTPIEREIIRYLAKENIVKVVDTKDTAMGIGLLGSIAGVCLFGPVGIITGLIPAWMTYEGKYICLNINDDELDELIAYLKYIKSTRLYHRKNKSKISLKDILNYYEYYSK